MESRNLELAAEFCKVVGSPNLLDYLGLGADADPAEARAKLKARRKFMQGMQGNPKYKREALFLIKNYAALSEALESPPDYMLDSRRRAESEHLPVLEMTVRGVLAAGGLTAEQETFLRRNAIELGVSEQTFREVLKRLAKEAGVPLEDGLPTPPPPPTRDTTIDLYELLGVDVGANEEQIQAAFALRAAEIGVDEDDHSEQLLKRVEIARKVLSNQAARRHYDLTAARTGPPARNRDHRPDQAATAPPVRNRQRRPAASSSGSGVPARLEILGDPVRPLHIRSGMALASIVLRNGGDQPMAGVVTVDVPWMAVDPQRLDPASKEQEISVQVDGQDVPEEAGTAVVTIQTERGESAQVVFEVDRGAGWPMWVGLGAAAVVLVLIGIGLLLQMQLL